MGFLSLSKAIVQRVYHSKYLNKYGFSGDYRSWSGAQLKCSGYSTDNILEKVKHATLQVKKGEAVYERDSVLFDHIQYSWPLLSGLMWVAASKISQLNVLDFGGSLGSSYFQNKKFLDTIRTLHWNVVEQKKLVETGIKIIQDERLQFYFSIEDVLKNTSPDIFLLSCTLPYLEDPYSFLETIVSYRFPYILIDNTYFHCEARDRICVQKVPPSIYDASYPCWFLNYEKVIAIVKKSYSIVSQHNNDSAIYLDGQKIQYQGFIAKLN